MPDKSAPAVRDHAGLSPASGVSLIAIKSPAMPRWLRRLPPDSRKAAKKCVGTREAPAKNCGHRPKPDARCGSSAAPADALDVFPEHRDLHQGSCLLVANAPAVQ